VDAVIVKMVENPEQVLRLKMIEIAGQRRIAKAMPALLKDMSDKDVEVRTAAAKSYGELAGATEIPVLIDMLMKSSDGGEIGTYERILSSACSQANDKEACTKKLVEAMSKAGSVSKPALLKVLGVAGVLPWMTRTRMCIRRRSGCWASGRPRMLRQCCLIWLRTLAMITTSCSVCGDVLEWQCAVKCRSRTG
jgi:hypothetical protein